MSGGRSEYEVEYCDLRGKRRTREGEGGGVVTCKKSLDLQPVGGRVAEAYRRRMEEEARRRAEDAETQRTTRVRVPPFPDLPVPDVHKLRYMHNNYMTPDDWYGSFAVLDNSVTFTQNV